MNCVRSVPSAPFQVHMDMACFLHIVQSDIDLYQRSQTQLLMKGE